MKTTVGYCIISFPGPLPPPEPDPPPLPPEPEPLPESQGKEGGAVVIKNRLGQNGGAPGEEYAQLSNDN